MAWHTWPRWRGLAALAVLLPLLTVPIGQARTLRVAAPPEIRLIAINPADPSLRYGVDAVEQVVRSTDGGVTWAALFSPGDAQAPDPATPGACLPGNYDRVTSLAIDPANPRGLYVGTDGVLGDYLDNGCGNSPGGLYYSATGDLPFHPLNHGLPASADTRGGGVAWGVRAITVDPQQPTTLYVQTDPSFVAGPGNSPPANPLAPGIYRSTDAGVQWDPAFNGISTTSCILGPCRNPGGLAVQGSLLLFAGDTGFYRSLDRGSYWQRQATLSFGDRTRFLVRIDPYRTNLAYVATDSAIYRTDDAGLRLTRLQRRDLPAPSQIAEIDFVAGTPMQVRFTLRDGRTVVVQDGVQGSGTPAPLTTPVPLFTRIPTLTVTASPVSRGPTPRPTIPATSPSPTTASSPPTAVPTIAAAGSTTWPMLGHDAAQSNFDSAVQFSTASIAKLRLRWQRTDAVPEIVANGKVYAIAGSSANVLSLHAADGALSHRFQSTGVQSVAAAGRYLYFDRGTEIRIVDAFTAAWQHSATAIQGTAQAAFSSVVTDGTHLYTGVAARNSGYLARHYAFDGRTGAALWSRNGNFSSVPCLAGGVLYLSFGVFGSGTSYLLNPAHGIVLGVVKDLGTADWHSAGGRVYASALHGSNGKLRAFVRAYDLSGRTRWVVPDVLFGAAQPDRLFAVAPGWVDARSAVDGHLLWKLAVPGLSPGSVESGLAAASDTLFAQSADGRISVIDARNGRLLRLLQPPASATSAEHLIVAGGMVYESVRARGSGATSTLLAFGS